MPGVQPAVERVRVKVRRHAAELFGLIVMAGPGDNPAHVRPPGAIAGRVRVARFVAFGVMDAVGGHPKYGSAFEGQRATEAQEILSHFGNLVTAMGVQAVIAHADATADGQPIEEGGDHDGAPFKEERSRDGAGVEDDQSDGGRPVDGPLVVDGGDFGSHRI